MATVPEHFTSSQHTPVHSNSETTSPNAQFGNVERNGFDPYHKWLGVPPDQDTISAYQLLGLRDYENDLDAIQEAADKQMAHVQTKKTGKHGHLTQVILNELSTAKVLLLNPEKKSAYDAKLGASSANDPLEQIGSDVSGSAEVIVEGNPKAALQSPFDLQVSPANVESARKLPRVSRKNKRIVAIASTAVGLVAVLVGGAVALVSGSGKKDVTQETLDALDPKAKAKTPSNEPVRTKPIAKQDFSPSPVTATGTPAGSRKLPSKGAVVSEPKQGSPVQSTNVGGNNPKPRPNDVAMVPSTTVDPVGPEPEKEPLPMSNEIESEKSRIIDSWDGDTLSEEYKSYLLDIRDSMNRVNGDYTNSPATRFAATRLLLDCCKNTGQFLDVDYYANELARHFEGVDRLAEKMAYMKGISKRDLDSTSNNQAAIVALRLIEEVMDNREYTTHGDELVRILKMYQNDNDVRSSDRQKIAAILPRFYAARDAYEKSVAYENAAEKLKESDHGSPRADSYGLGSIFWERIEGILADPSETNFRRLQSALSSLDDKDGKNPFSSLKAVVNKQLTNFENATPTSHREAADLWASLLKDTTITNSSTTRLDGSGETIRLGINSAGWKEFVQKNIKRECHHLAKYVAGRINTGQADIHSQTKFEEWFAKHGFDDLEGLAQGVGIDGVEVDEGGNDEPEFEPGVPISLAQFIDGQQYQLAGNWIAQNGAYSTNPGKNQLSILKIPLQVDGSYEFEGFITMETGQTAVEIQLTVGGADVQFCLRDGISGWDQVDGKRYSKNKYKIPIKLPSGMRMRIGIRVTEENDGYQLEASLNGKPISTIAVKPSQLSLPPEWKNGNSLGFGVWSGRAVIDNSTITPGGTTEITLQK